MADGFGLGFKVVKTVAGVRECAEVEGDFVFAAKRGVRGGGGRGFGVFFREEEEDAAPVIPQLFQRGVFAADFGVRRFFRGHERGTHAAGLDFSRKQFFPRLRLR